MYIVSTTESPTRELPRKMLRPLQFNKVLRTSISTDGSSAPQRSVLILHQLDIPPDRLSFCEPLSRSKSEFIEQESLDFPHIIKGS